MTNPKIPPRSTGLRHVFAATRYSLNGLYRIWREAAFRQELLVGTFALIVLVAIGASPGNLVLFLLCFLFLLAIEAMNTAIEELVDHLSPEWTQFGKNAKDLGSFAVACAIAATAVAFGWALLG